MLVILERNVRDQRMLWAALWQGFQRASVCGGRYHPAGTAFQVESAN